ncbi:MAG TPA: M56 family metallopeptidase, partial [Bryobacteraceae bacterium]|nr:M56 family metallopeptidase [Bryobacteraceae bacterium]
MTALGWALVHFLWQGAVIALVLAVALGAMRRSSAQARYVAACLALLTMAMCVPATSLLLNSGGKVALPPGEKGLILDSDLNAHAYFDWQRWVVLCWAAGATALLMRTAMGWHVARRNSRRGVEWDYPLSQLMERMRMSGTVELVVSRLADAPQVFGWLKPVILVPASAIARLSPAEMEAVLVHELAHIVRRDYLVNLIQTVVESLLFYHPAVWWVSRRIRQEREHCCDDIAVKVCGDRRRYSRALLKLEETRPAFAMAATAGGMKMRITRLLGYPVEGSTWGPGVAATGAILLLGGLIWASQPPVPAPPAPPEAPAVAGGAPAHPAAPKLAMASTPAVPAVPAAPLTPAVPVELKTIDGVVDGVAGGVVAGVSGGVVNGVPQPPQSPSPTPAPQPAAVPDAPPAPPPPPPVKALTDEERAKLAEIRERIAEQRAQHQAEVKARIVEQQAQHQAEVKERIAEQRAQHQAEVKARIVEQQAQRQARLAGMQLDQQTIAADAQVALELALKDLQLNKQQIEVNIREAVEKAKLQLADVNVQKEAHASMEKALAELKLREPEIRKNIEVAMSRLDSELKDLDGKLRLERSEHKRRIDYADQRWSKGDV